MTRRSTPGGAGPLAIGPQLERFAARLESDRVACRRVTGPRRLVPRSFYSRAPDVVARELLNKVLIGPNGSGRIVEVEAYDGARDPASHAYRGSTPRNAVMFGPPGHLYVYFTYGMHWCANAVCREDGEAAAVLLRALAPIDGLEVMRSARLGRRRDRDFAAGRRSCARRSASGPRTTASISRDERRRCASSTTAPRHHHRLSSRTRIGLTVGVDQPWRWYVAADDNVSRK